MKKTITIFGSSLPKEGDKEFEDAYLLGSLLAKGNFNICTGGYRGIMHAASKGAKENGAEAIGITVDLWGATPSEYLTQEIKCENLFERITKLIEAGDGYIILQGGTGTLLELSAVWELMNKGLITKKLAACHSTMWSDIVPVIDKQIRRENRTAGLIECFDNVEAIADYFKRNMG
ncbi:MAG TPA: LOG family protein [Ignavibacteriaceae bacterium]|nr:LOG family protein [Ignavibacteriaceae bacterium]